MKWLPWVGVLGVFAVLVGVVAPGRGAAWFNDDGLFLVLSWNAATASGWTSASRRRRTICFTRS
jgi:hypothetical protein